MNRATLIFWIGLASVLVGCGGGGPAPIGTTGSFGNLTSARVEATFVADPSRGIDVRDLVAGDVVRIRVYGIDPITLNLVEGSVASWSLTAPSGVGVIDSNGVLSAIAGSGSSYQLVALSGTNSLSTAMKISALTARVAGRLRTSTDERVRNIPVRFMNAAGAVVATSYTSGTGDFYANVPTTAVSFIADLSSRTDRYYNQYSYGPRDYSSSVSGCKAALPTLSAGSVTRLPNDLVTYVKSAGSPPPPPPSGCLL